MSREAYDEEQVLAERREAFAEEEKLTQEEKIEFVSNLLPRTREVIYASDGFRDALVDKHRSLVDKGILSLQGTDPIQFKHDDSSYSFSRNSGDYYPHNDQLRTIDKHFEFLEVKEWENNKLLQFKAVRMWLVTNRENDEILEAGFDYGESGDHGLRLAESDIEARMKINEMLQPFLSE